MKKYKLLKDLPWIKAWTIFTVDDTKVSREDWYNSSMYVNSYFWANLKDELWFEPIEEKKTFDNIEKGDEVWYIGTDWGIEPANYRKNHCRSEIFLTSEEAEDEHKRREWANRKGKFVPEEWEYYYFYRGGKELDITWNIYRKNWFPFEWLIINSWLAFRTEQECQYAIDNHDIVRLFYTIR